jgi:hypothetical protein
MATGNMANATTVMNNVNIVVCETLCYIRNNFDKSTSAAVKGVLANFYTDDEIVAAKELFFKNLSDLEIKDAVLPRLIKRKGESKHKQNVDDLFELIQFADEKLLYNKLPRYVAADLSRIPSVSVENLDLMSLLRRVERAEIRISSLEVKNTGESDKRQKNEDVQGARGKFVGIFPENWGDCDNGAVPAEGSSSDEEGNGWVLGGRKRHSKVIDGLRNARSGAFAEQHPKASTEVTKSRKKIACGSSKTNNTSGIGAGVPIVRKFVCHVDNLNVSCTEESVTNFLKDNNVNVV